MNMNRYKTLFGSLNVSDDALERLYRASAENTAPVRHISYKKIFVTTCAVFLVCLVSFSVLASETELVTNLVADLADSKPGLSRFFGLFIENDSDKTAQPSPILDQAEMVLAQTKQYGNVRITFESAYADDYSIAALFTIETIDGSPLIKTPSNREDENSIYLYLNWDIVKNLAHNGMSSSSTGKRVDDYSNPARAQIYYRTEFQYANKTGTAMGRSILGQNVNIEIGELSYNYGEEKVYIVGDKAHSEPLAFNIKFNEILKGKKFNTEIASLKHDVNITPIGVYLFTQGKSILAQSRDEQPESFSLELTDGTVVQGSRAGYSTQENSEDGLGGVLGEPVIVSQISFFLHSTVSPEKAAALIIDGIRYDLKETS